MKNRTKPETVSAPEEASKVKFGIGRKNFFGQGAIILLALAIVFRIIGCWGQWNNKIFLVMELALPVVSCLLYALCIYFLGRKGFFLSFLPVLMGAAFFAYKSLSCGNMVYTVLYMLFCAVVAVVYACTMFGSIRTKWLLPPLFALPFVFFVIRDLPALGDTANPVTFAAGMQEMAILCLLLGMLLASFGIKKRRPPVIPVVDGETVEVPPMPEVDTVVPADDAEGVPAEPEMFQAAAEPAPVPAEPELPEAELPEAEVPELLADPDVQESVNEE